MIRCKFLVICLSLLGVLLMKVAADAQEMMSVQVKEGHLRATTAHLGKIVATVSYGDRVTVTEERGAWKKVSLSDGKTQGWMHETALSGKRIVLSAGKGDVGTSVSRDEIALAGKGFNREVEDRYRRDNRNLDYTWINRMEEIKVSAPQMDDFIVSGLLPRSGEGGKP